jgi:hypothetical protein
MFNRPLIKPPPIVVNPPPIEINPPVVTKPQPGKPPAVAGAARTFDLLAIIDLNHDVVDGKGKFQMQGGKLVCTEGNFVPRVQVPYIPPREFDYSVTFSQPGLRNGISLIIPKAEGGMFYWAVGFHDGNGYGFDADHGADIAQLIRPNVQYTTTVQVRQGLVRALLNNKLLLESRDIGNLRTDDWRRMTNDRILGVACDDPCTFHRIQIVEVTGNGRPAR